MTQAEIEEMRQLIYAAAYVHFSCVDTQAGPDDAMTCAVMTANEWANLARKYEAERKRIKRGMQRTAKRKAKR